MAVDNFHVDLTFPAAADLSTKQYLFVKLDGNGKAAICAAATDKPIGILQNKPDAANKSATVRVLGISKVKYAGTSAPGDALGTDTNGLAATYTNADTTKFMVAVATNAGNSAANDIGQCFIDTSNTHKHA